MSFLDHLDELRKRLIRSIVFVFVATSSAGFFRIAFTVFWPYRSSVHWPKPNDARCQLQD